MELDEDICELLNELAQNLEGDAKQQDAIKLSAAAVLYVIMKHKSDFMEFYNSLEAPLTSEQEQSLRDKGLM